MKILIGPSSFGAQNPKPLEYLQNAGYEVVQNPYGRKLEKKEVLTLLNDCDGIIAGLEVLDHEVIEKTGVKVISRCGSGISNVDLNAVDKFGVQFVYTPEGPTQAVAEITVGMMLTLLRNAFFLSQQMEKKIWQKYVGYQLAEKKVLIIGFGKIGKRVAQLLTPFNLTLYVVDPLSCQEGIEGDNIRVVSLEEGLKEADLITIHASGEDLILGKQQFSLLKQGVFILNAGRGGQIDENLLLEAVKNGQVQGVWLDSFSKEPYQGPLTSEPAIITTPHIGSYTQEGRLKMEMEAAINLVEKFQEVRPGTL